MDWVQRLRLVGLKSTEERDEIIRFMEDCKNGQCFASIKCYYYIDFELASS
jgi:hypothetical protein